MENDEHARNIRRHAERNGIVHAIEEYVRNLDWMELADWSIDNSDDVKALAGWIRDWQEKHRA